MVGILDTRVESRVRFDSPPKAVSSFSNFSTVRVELLCRVSFFKEQPKDFQRTRVRHTKDFQRAFFKERFKERAHEGFSKQERFKEQEPKDFQRAFSKSN